MGHIVNDDLTEGVDAERIVHLDDDDNVSPQVYQMTDIVDRYGRYAEVMT